MVDSKANSKFISLSKYLLNFVNISHLESLNKKFYSILCKIA